MNIKIDSAVIKQFPDAKIGLLIGKNVNNKNIIPDVATLIRQEEQEIGKKFTLENVASIPKILDWREAYRSFGCKPSEYRSSIEALLRRILQSKQLPSINTLVDLYNLISIKHVLPAGGGNLDKVEGSIILKIALGTEQFIMLGQTEPVTIKAGEVVYVDDKEVLCRAWNYRESEKTKITENTSNVYLVIEGLKHTTHEEIRSALSELQQLLAMHCGGSFTGFVLDRDNPEISF